MVGGVTRPLNKAHVGESRKECQLVDNLQSDLKGRGGGDDTSLSPPLPHTCLSIMYEIMKTWSYSALGNCSGSLVVSMSQAQMRGSAR